MGLAEEYEVELPPSEFKIFISRNEIADLVSNISNKISKDYFDEIINGVVVLGGARPFSIDLYHNLRMNGYMPDFDHVRVSSYRGENSTNKPKLIIPTQYPVKDKKILLIDDIADTGQTIKFLTEELTKQGAIEVKVAVLLDKPSKRVVDIKTDYVGRVIPDKFVIGYGLDLDGKYRTLPDIYAKQN